MIIWICAVYMKDRKTSEELRNLDGVEPIITVIRSGMLRWYGHVLIKVDGVCAVCELLVYGMAPNLWVRCHA